MYQPKPAAFGSRVMPLAVVVAKRSPGRSATWTGTPAAPSVDQRSAARRSAAAIAAVVSEPTGSAPDAGRPAARRAYIPDCAAPAETANGPTLTTKATPVHATVRHRLACVERFTRQPFSGAQRSRVVIGQ